MFKNLILKNFELVLNGIFIMGLILVALVVIFNNQGIAGFIGAIGIFVFLILYLGVMYLFVDIRSILIEIRDKKNI
ncbi:MAG: hypothetical protein LBP38_00140 [Desulfovibrio sp.]|nr:hypothetical protein [Desulfovibrio sp.]